MQRARIHVPPRFPHTLARIEALAALAGTALSTSRMSARSSCPALGPCRGENLAANLSSSYQITFAYRRREDFV